MRRRGLTMIEMLVATALLALITIAAASWAATAGRLIAASGAPARRSAVIESLFGVIQRDLVVGDLQTAERTGASPSIPWIQVKDGMLEVRGRANVIHRYQLDRANHILERSTSGGEKWAANGGLSGGVAETRGSDLGMSRALLHDVQDFTVTLDDVNRTLDVTIDMRVPGNPTPTSRSGGQVTRRFNLTW